MSSRKAEPVLALIGNPNSGKSTLFNRLTGLRQRTGNFPGVTVEQKVGTISIAGKQVTLIDAPGTYSLFSTSEDERVVARLLLDYTNAFYPDALIYVADIQQLDRHLLLFRQVQDLGFPLVLALNFADELEEELYDLQVLEKELGTAVIALSARQNKNFDELLQSVEKVAFSGRTEPISLRSSYTSRFSVTEREVAKGIQQELVLDNEYAAKLIAHHYKWLDFISKGEKEAIARITDRYKFQDLKLQVRETMQRYQYFEGVLRRAKTASQGKSAQFSDRLDNVLTHKIWGPLIFIFIMVLTFQLIYSWSSIPMDGIEWVFSEAGTLVSTLLPEGWMRSLVVDGLLAGLGGIVIFVPQIALLFFIISILEEAGYMSRAVYLFDPFMRRFGLNGRSIVALVSGGACAIPAIMATRTITNWKERLITILVTPFISCSARLPVYAIVIALVIPTERIWGVFNLQGLVLFGLYLLGIIAALGSAWILKMILKSEDPSFLLLEMPDYRMPDWRSVALNVYDKVKSFVLEAGKVILLISLLLWVLAQYGPPGKIEAALEQMEAQAEQESWRPKLKEQRTAAIQLEYSYAGYLGKAIEPVIRPLGYDWRIGIALITSFAAREVFVGTLATIFNLGEADENDRRLRYQLKNAKIEATGRPLFTLASGLSILVFYVLAMQCMSTLAVVKKETQSWKWPLLQLVAMTLMAYGAAALVWTLLS